MLLDRPATLVDPRVYPRDPHDSADGQTHACGRVRGHRALVLDGTFSLSWAVLMNGASLCVTRLAGLTVGF